MAFLGGITDMIGSAVGDVASGIGSGIMGGLRSAGSALASPFTYDPPPNPYDSEGFTQRQAQRAKRQREEIARLRAGGVSEKGQQVIREGREIAGQVRGAAKQTRGSLGGTAQEAGERVGGQIMMGARGQEQDVSQEALEQKEEQQEALEDIGESQKLGYAATVAQGEEAQKQSNVGMLTQLASAGIMALAMSDRRIKSNVRDGSKDIEQMLDALSPKTYNKLGREETGVMAQDLERTPGAGMVKDLGGIKGIAMSPTETLAIAAYQQDKMNEQEERIKALEAMLKKKRG